MNKVFINANENINLAINRLIGWMLPTIFAVTVTIFLIALMHVLIAGPKVNPINITERAMVDIVLIEAVIETHNTVVKPVKDEPLIEPAIPNFTDDALPVVADRYSMAAYSPEPLHGNNNIQLAPSNLPVARMMMAPEYPESAARRRLEGYVNVRFDITKTGATANVEVIDAMPEGVFDKAAIKAVKRWKYTPPMQEGEPIEFYGMAKRVVFEMEK